MDICMIFASSILPSTCTKFAKLSNNPLEWTKWASVRCGMSFGVLWYVGTPPYPLPATHAPPNRGHHTKEQKNECKMGTSGVG